MIKTENLIIFVLFALVLNLSSCEPVGLPDITETGENTFGMKVDGKDWIASSSIGINYSPPILSVQYYSISRGLVISSYNEWRNESVTFYIPNVVGVGDYFFTCGYSLPDMSDADSTNNYCRTRFIKYNNDDSPENNFVLYDKNESNMRITKFDTINKIISGTFSVNLYNSYGEKIEITDGRFEVELQIYP